MKKKIYGAAIAVAIAAFGVFNLNIKADTNNVSILTMDNIEALADGESDTELCKEYCEVQYGYLCWIETTDRYLYCNDKWAK